MKNILDEELIDELDDSILDETDTVDELSFDDDRTITDYLEDPEEDEAFDELTRRKEAYSVLRKDDKIFNNSFNMGTGGDDSIDTKKRNEIRVDPGSAEYNYYDKDKHSDIMDETITYYDIDAFVTTSPAIQQIIGNISDISKKKFTKQEINKLFDEIRLGIAESQTSSAFVNSIHILDSISSLTNLEYKKLFDMLTYENKEILLVELDKKYNFLNRSPKDSKMYE